MTRQTRPADDVAPGLDQVRFARPFKTASSEQVGARADGSISETVSLGISADWTNDNDNQTVIGPTKSQTVNVLAMFPGWVMARW